MLGKFRDHALSCCCFIRLWRSCKRRWRSCKRRWPKTNLLLIAWVISFCVSLVSVTHQRALVSDTADRGRFGDDPFFHEIANYRNIPRVALAAFSFRCHRLGGRAPAICMLVRCGCSVLRAVVVLVIIALAKASTWRPIDPRF